MRLYSLDFQLLLDSTFTLLSVLFFFLGIPSFILYKFFKRRK